MYKSLSASLTILMLISACGGGGGNASGSSSAGPVVVTPPSLDLKTAWATYLKQSSSKNFSISGSLNGSGISGNGTYITSYTSPVVVQAFNLSNSYGVKQTLDNVSKTVTVFNANVFVNGSSSLSTTTTEYYTDANGAIKVINDVNSNEQTVVTSFSSFPTLITVGAGGTLYAGNVYSNLGYPCGTESASYAASADTVSTLLVTLTVSQNTTRQALNQCTTRSSVTQYVYRLGFNTLSLLNVSGSGSVAAGTVTYTF